MQVKKLIPEEIVKKWDGLLLDPSTNFQYADKCPGGPGYDLPAAVAAAKKWQELEDEVKASRETHPHIIVR